MLNVSGSTGSMTPSTFLRKHQHHFSTAVEEVGVLGTVADTLREEPTIAASLLVVHACTKFAESSMAVRVVPPPAGLVAALTSVTGGVGGGGGGGGGAGAGVGGDGGIKSPTNAATTAAAAAAAVLGQAAGAISAAVGKARPPVLKTDVFMDPAEVAALEEGGREGGELEMGVGRGQRLYSE
jgi:hypothetical protein